MLERFDSIDIIEGDVEELQEGVVPDLQLEFLEVVACEIDLPDCVGLDKVYIGEPIVLEVDLLHKHLIPKHPKRAIIQITPLQLPNLTDPHRLHLPQLKFAALLRNHRELLVRVEAVDEEEGSGVGAVEDLH